MTTPQSPAPLLALSPCPGCGGTRTRVIGGPGTKGGPQYWAGCDICRWRTWGHTEYDAITAWNTREPDPTYWQLQHAAALRVIDELRAANAREGGEWNGEAFERAYVTGYRAALGAASAECRRIGEALDNAGNTYVRYEDAIKCAVAVSALRPPAPGSDGGL